MTDTLITPDGQVRLGLFERPPADINGRDFDYRTPLGRPQSALARHLHYKQFQYFGVLADRVLAGCALAHTGYVGLAFVYVHDLATNTLTERTLRLPLGRGLAMSRSPVEGESRLAASGAGIRLGYRRHADGSLLKTLQVRLHGRTPMTIDAELPEPASYRSLPLCTRTGINGWTFANKVAGLPVSGRISAAGQDYDLAGLGACGHHDFSAGYMRRETFWNWACLSGRVRTGGRERLLGLNLSCGVNETSFSENCLWLDGQRVATGLTRFDYDARDPVGRPWQVRTADGSVDLAFRPAGAHTEKMNLLLFATDFKQVFGHFHGTVMVGNETLAVAGLPGFVEEQYAKW
ncbi:MAG: DUF2804 domain-containing protein [Pseudomonadota bacterium]